jgi:two-component system sensor histidine kinase BaeS
LTWVAARRILRPIAELRDATRDLASGQLTRRVSAEGEDEVAELSRSFNTMAERLERQVSLRRDLIHDVAHELKTPLTAMRCRVETILDNMAQDPKAALGQINEDVAHLSRLVSDLEDLAHAEGRDLAFSIATVEVEGAFTSALRAASLEGDPRLRIEIERGLAVEADPTRLRQVLVNLLTNADRHTPPDGAITLRAARRDSAAVISVHNTGSALTPAELERVFDRFYRADPSRQRATGGSGLGLAIVKQLVEAQSGAVSARSDDSGVTFEVTLPTR